MEIDYLFDFLKWLVWPSCKVEVRQREREIEKTSHRNFRAATCWTRRWLRSSQQL